MKSKLLISVILLTSLRLSAQATPAQPQAPLSPASLTELELTKLELDSAQSLLLRNQQQDLQTKHNEHLAEIAKNHPGYTFNPQTGQLSPIPVQLDPKSGLPVGQKKLAPIPCEGGSLVAGKCVIPERKK